MNSTLIRRAFASVLLSGFLLLCAAAPMQAGVGPVADTQSTMGLEDRTDKLSLRPGLSISFPVYRGVDTRWKSIGNYEFSAQVIKYGAEGLTFDWKMTYPADASGSRAVTPEDLKESTQVSLFYPKQESCTMVGFTNALRVSDALYKALKEGRRSAFQLDGPEQPPGFTRDPRFSPRSIEPSGEEYVAIRLNNGRAKVRAIKATTDNGWTYWIMDNPQFPMMVQGDAPFGWSEPLFDTTVAEQMDAARDLIKQLEEKGEATTYAILFDFNKATLKPQSKPILDDLGKYLSSHSDLKLEVQGHTDNVGSLEYNMKLSQRRSASVKDYLVKHAGINAGRLKPEGYGYLRPLVKNTTAAGRAKNRRVVFKKI